MMLQVSMTRDWRKMMSDSSVLAICIWCLAWLPSCGSGATTRSEVHSSRDFNPSELVAADAFVRSDTRREADVPGESPGTEWWAVAIVSPENGAVVSGTVAIEMTVYGDAEILEVEFLVHGETLAIDVESPYLVEWDTTGSPDGGCGVKAIARTNSGEEDTSEILVLVDNSGNGVDSPPTLFFEQPEADR